MKAINTPEINLGGGTHTQMGSHPIFMDCKNQYYLNIHTAQTNCRFNTVFIKILETIFDE